MSVSWARIQLSGSRGTHRITVSCDFNNSYYDRSARVVYATVHLPRRYVELIIIQRAKSSEFVLKDSTGALLKDKSGNYLIVK